MRVAARTVAAAKRPIDTAATAAAAAGFCWMPASRRATPHISLIWGAPGGRGRNGQSTRTRTYTATQTRTRVAAAAAKVYLCVYQGNVGAVDFA